MADPYAAFSSPAGADPYAAFSSRQDAAPVATPASPAAPQQKPAGYTEKGWSEAALNMGSGMIATPLAGIAGLGTLATNALGITDADPTNVIHGVQGALTYQPRTQAGDTATQIVSYPFQKLAQGADYLGGKTAELTGSPAAGAAVNTAVNFAPALLTHRVFASNKTASANSASVASAAAQDFVNTKTSLKWKSLPDEIKTRLESVASDAGALDKLDPAAVERQIRLQQLPAPVPATKGQLTRDVVQLRNEQNVSATEGGKAIRQVYVDQNRALVNNLDILKGRIPAKAATPEEVGLSVQDAALRDKLAQQKAKVRELYKQAESSGELQGPVSPKPVMDLLDNSPDLTHLGWVQSWLNRVKATKTETAGGTTVETTKQLTLKEMEDLRQAAVAKAMDGGTEGYYAGKVIDAIDNATDGAGGVAYKAARAARKAQALEFQDQGAVARLVENKTRTDRSVALEDTWRKTVIGGSLEDLNNVKRSLLTGEFATARAAGRQAWRDLQAQTIQHIKDTATKSVTRFEDGTPNVTPAAMEQAIRSVGDAKIDALFSKGTARRIRQIMQATRDVKTTPPSGYSGSGTFANALAFMEKGLGKIPLLGDVASGTVRAVGKVREMGAAGRQVRESQQMPLPENAGANALARQRNRNALTRNSGAVVTAAPRNKN